MSLYYDAAPLLLSSPNNGGSLKSRIFNSKDLKSPAKQVYALVTEASKWSPILTEVIEKSHLLQLERKLSPNLALLLVHDLLLAKHGISAPAAHPLRVVVEQHKARLSAELVRARLRRGLRSLEELRLQVEGGTIDAGWSEKGENIGRKSDKVWIHPRWIRVNTLNTTMREQLQTTFTGYTTTDSLEQILENSSSPSEKLLHVDKHIPNLLALPSTTTLTKTAAYRNGLIILQDKASCFPAYLLDPNLGDGHCLDACAAPGNKTTHLAAILHEKIGKSCERAIYACERNPTRADTLRQMVKLAGADEAVTISAGQDFLSLDLSKEPWNAVGSLLLDPSCSGSGIVGRDEAVNVILPTRGITATTTKAQKRKRKTKSEVDLAIQQTSEEAFPTHDQSDVSLHVRLTALSTFQLKLLLHAFQFPNARKVTYSTCSLYAEENEHVIMKALDSQVARERGWRILPRDAQISGMQAWGVRGSLEACLEMPNQDGAKEIAEACIRCEKGTKEGTQGFFVAAMVRDSSLSSTNSLVGEEEWQGFSDGNDEA